MLGPSSANRRTGRLRKVTFTTALLLVETPEMAPRCPKHVAGVVLGLSYVGAAGGASFIRIEIAFGGQPVASNPTGA
jgi:hypothetical protein